MIDTVRMAFAALRDQTRGGGGDLAVWAVPDNPSPNQAYLAVDGAFRSHLLLSLPSESTIGDLGSASLDVGTRVLEVNGGAERFLDVSCDRNAAEVFEYFVVAACERVFRLEGPVPAITNLLDDWRGFLEPSSGVTSAAQARAVLGELLVLRDLAQRDPVAAVRSWSGPTKARHDFRWGDTALEVKTTRSHTSKVVTIHGVDQLEAPDHGTLFLHLVRLEEVPEGPLSLTDVVEDLLAMGCPSKLFELLAASGVTAADLPALRSYRFQVRDRITVPVDEGTPRLTQLSFVGGQVPPGIDDLSYRLDISHLAERQITDSEYGSLIATFFEGSNHASD